MTVDEALAEVDAHALDGSAGQVLAAEVRRVRGRTCWTCRFNEDGICRHDEVGGDLVEAACAVIRFCGLWAAKGEGC